MNEKVTAGSFGKRLQQIKGLVKQRKRALLAILMAVCLLFSMAGGIAPFSVWAASGDSVSDYGELLAAIALAPSVSTEYVVVIAASFDIDATVSIPSDKNVKLTSAGDYTLTTRGNYRHFSVSGEFTLEDGITLTNYDRDTYGGGVEVNNNGVFALSGGVISGNVAVNGGGVYVDENGVFTMNGGIISDNYVTYSSGGNGGGGVYVNRGFFTMTDGKIADNTAENLSAGGGGVYNHDGDVVINGGEISGNKARSGGGILGVGSTLTITDGAISGNTVTEYGGGVYNEGTFNLSGGEISNNTASLSGGGVICHGTLNMSGGAISGNGEGDGGGVHIMGTINMSAGEISGNRGGLGGGVYINYNSALNLSGGIISGNTAIEDGGGVCNFETLSMSGGAISGNTSKHGGGVLNAYDSVFTMNDGVISGNTVTQNGGGVYNTYDSIFTVNGGEISGNEASENGGGVYTGTDNPFTVNGGAISGNLAGGDGGGVYTESYADLYVAAGVTFTGNTASESSNYRNPTNDAVYATNILKPDYTWSASLKQGYNNYDINHAYGVPDYSVTFDGNGGAEPGNDMRFTPPDNALGADMPAAPERDGYTFTGWNTRADGTGTSFTEDTVVTEDIIVYAQWEPVETFVVTITGSNAGSSGAGSYEAGTLVSIDAGSRSGSTFTGWTVNSGDIDLDAANSATTTFIMPANGVTLTANWRSNGGGNNGGSAPTTTGTTETNNETDTTNENEATDETDTADPADTTEETGQTGRTDTQVLTEEPEPLAQQGYIQTRPTTASGNTLEPSGNGGYIEIGDNGSPLGEWRWDEEAEEWIFDAYTPLTNLPTTGDGSGATIGYILIILGITAAWLGLFPRKKGNQTI